MPVIEIFAEMAFSLMDQNCGLSQRQSVVALSRTEAKYIGPSNATIEVVWLNCLLIIIEVNNSCPVVLKMDNPGLIKLVKNPEFLTI